MYEYRNALPINRLDVCNERHLTGESLTPDRIQTPNVRPRIRLQFLTSLSADSHICIYFFWLSSFFFLFYPAPLQRTIQKSWRIFPSVFHPSRIEFIRVWTQVDSTCSVYSYTLFKSNWRFCSTWSSVREKHKQGSKSWEVPSVNSCY